MRRLILRIVAIVLISFGLVVWILPIPFGLPMVACGLVILIANSYWAAAGKVREARLRWPRLYQVLRKGGGWLPRSMHRILAGIDPRRKSRPQI
jgi:hypothetical protein